MSVPEGFINLDQDLEMGVRKRLRPKDVNEPLVNLVRGALAAHEHAFHCPSVSKEAFLSFMGKAWDAGEAQRKVFLGEVEGNATNEFGVAFNLACHVALYGETEGLLPKEVSAA